MRPSEIHQLSVRGLVTGLDVLGDGEPVLFVHGFPLDRSMWRELIGMLSGLRRIAPDLRGLGTTEGPSTGYSMAEYADDLAALLDVLKIERTVVCGLSMGGYVAFEFLRRHTSRVRGLLLLNTRAERDGDDARRRRDEMIAAVRRDGVLVLEDLLLDQLIAPGSLETMPQLAERLRAMLERHTQQGVVGAIEAMRDRGDSTELLPTIDVPTLVVAGKEDQLISVESSRKMAAAISGSQFTVIPDAGHVTPLEQPIATGRVVGEFLGSI